MVPLHAAFLLEKGDWIEDFHEHIVRFLAEGQSDYEGHNTLLRSVEALVVRVHREHERETECQ